MPLAGIAGMGSRLSLKAALEVDRGRLRPTFYRHTAAAWATRAAKPSPALWPGLLSRPSGPLEQADYEQQDNGPRHSSDKRTDHTLPGHTKLPEEESAGERTQNADVQVPHSIRVFACRAGYGCIGKSWRWYTSQTEDPGFCVTPYARTAPSLQWPRVQSNGLPVGSGVQSTSVCVTKGLPDALQREVAGMEGTGVAGLLLVLVSAWGLLGRDSAPSTERRATAAIELAEELPVNHAAAGNQSPPSAIVSAILPRSQHVDLVVLGGRS